MTPNAGTRQTSSHQFPPGSFPHCSPFFGFKSHLASRLALFSRRHFLVCLPIARVTLIVECVTFQTGILMPRPVKRPSKLNIQELPSTLQNKHRIVVPRLCCNPLLFVVMNEKKKRKKSVPTFIPGGRRMPSFIQPIAIMDPVVSVPNWQPFMSASLLSGCCRRPFF